jgi:hypothetical protein
MDGRAKLAMVLVFLGATSATHMAYLATLASLARTLRVGVVGYKLGIGPVVLQTPKLTLRLLPLSASFQPALKRLALPHPPALAAALERGALRHFDELPLAVSIGLTFCSTLIPLLGAAAAIGVEAAARAMAGGMFDFVRGAVGPLSTAPRLLDEAFANYQGRGPLSVLGHDLAVVAAMDLLLSGNTLFLLGWLTRSERLQSLRFGMVMVGLVAMASWCVAFGIWLTRA